jgi:hypothetical protein
MSFIEREMHKVREAFTLSKDETERNRLYAAQQALAWASDPECYDSPYRMILENAQNAFCHIKVEEQHKVA